MKQKIRTDLIEQMTVDGRDGRLNRREFIRYAIAAGMTVPAASMLWSSNVLAATPKKGGKFRLGSADGNTSDTFDPGIYLAFTAIQLAHTHRSFLTMITPTNELGPDLADSWSASDDASEWTFKLNRDAVFHSGKPFTADDAIATINHHRGENSTSAAASLMADVKELVKHDQHSFTVKLTGGNADFPWLLTDYHMAVCPANADGTIEWQSGDGTGPYKITHNEFGVSFNLVRHDGWHGEGAYFDEVEIIVLNDPNARQTALITDEVDAISQVELKTLALLKRNPKIEIDDVSSGAAITLPMRTDLKPFDNYDVRMALKLAVDRQELIDKIAFGGAALGNDVHISSNMPYYAKLPQREYDPDKARHHLKKAGMENLEVTLQTADSIYPGAVDLCVLYAEQAKAAGIKINVKRVPNDGFWSDTWLTAPWCMASWGARPTPDQIFTLTYKDGAAWNESYWKNKRFNELLLIAKAELDQDKRHAQYKEMQEIAHDDGGTVIPFFPNFVYARAKRVQHGPNISGAWQIDGARGTSRWWFA